MKSTLLMLAVYLICTSILSGQRALERSNYFGISSGFNSIMVIDEIVSPNEYKGGGVLYGLSWGDVSTKRIILIDTRFSRINSLEFDASKAEFKEWQIDYRNLFSLCEGELFSNPFEIYLGPGLSFNADVRDQHTLGVESTFYTLGVTFNVLGSMRISEDWSLNSSLLFTPVSMAYKKAFTGGTEPMKILPFNSLLHFGIKAGCSYKISNLLNCSAVYYFQILSVSAWDYFRMLEDKMFIQLELRF